MKTFRCPRCGGPYFGSVILALWRDGQFVERFGTARPGDQVARIKYRCHSTPDGKSDATAGAAFRAEYGTHAVFPGAKAKPCGWEITFDPRSPTDHPEECFGDD